MSDANVQMNLSIDKCKFNLFRGVKKIVKVEYYLGQFAGLLCVI